MIKSFIKKSISPFAKDTSSLFLPLMIMFMVFMATLSSGVVIAINSMTNHWNKSISSSLTIQVKPSLEKPKNKTDTTEIKIEKSLILLRKVKNIKEVKLLNNNEIKKLLEPWLGSNNIIEDIPLPQLIDVKINNNNPKAIKEIEAILKKHLPEASLDNHKIWTARLAKLVESLKFLSFVTLYLIVGATIFIVIYVTRTSLAVHRPVIGLLHLIGAKDSYVCLQYAKRTFFLAIIGGFFGFIIATPALLFIGSLAFNLGGGPLSSLNLEKNEWIVMSLIPFLTAVLSMLIAYFTVKRDLLRML